MFRLDINFFNIEKRDRDVNMVMCLNLLVNTHLWF